jgi:SAM-dependent methyltransferase
MLELARAKGSPGTSASIEYAQCAADALEIPDDAVDLVTCQQGLQFFPNRPAAVAEMRRVLRPGGRVGVAVWSEIEDCPPFAALATVLGDVFGAETADTYRSGPWGFGDPASLSNLFEDGGFTDVKVQTRELPVVFEGGPAQLMLTLHAAAVATQVSELDESGLSRLVAAVGGATRPFTFEGAVRSFATSHILTASVCGP